MDKRSAAVDIIKAAYKAQSDSAATPDLISLVCKYFDGIKSDILSDGDLHFLRRVANEAGIPQYYEMLVKLFRQDINNRVLDVDLVTLSSMIKESSLYVGENISLHKYQKDILNRFCKNQKNRFFLSASTSFGKTFLVYEILRKMQYRNIFLIFPTIALLSENIVKIYTNQEYSWIKNDYKIHTISDVTDFAEKNLYLFTPERFLSFIDKHSEFENDFVFVDEVYKIDNEYLEEEEYKENERDVAYRIALHYALRNESTDCLLAGPYINLSQRGNADSNQSIYGFLDDNSIEVLDYNKYEIVGKSEYDVGSKSNIQVDEGNFILKLSFAKGKEARFVALTYNLLKLGENVIAYCSSKASAEKYAKVLIDSNLIENIDTTPFQEFLNHIESLFANRAATSWVVAKALRKGVGVHHGLVPKYIQNEIIHLYNAGFIKVLICTTTITEGVNTSGKNMIVLAHKKGRKELKPFDAKNIEGRAGRFFYHYTGRVFLMDNQFKEKAHADNEGLRHKHYDKDANKSEVDFPYVASIYLNDADIELKKRWSEKVDRNQIDKIVLESFKTIPIDDKIYLYGRITKMTDTEKLCIRDLIRTYLVTHRIKKKGIEVICDIIKPIVTKNSELLQLIELRRGSGEYCTFTNMMSVFISGGFSNGVNYYVHTGLSVDEAVRRTAKFIYNTLRYQAVKFFGLFNLTYKSVISKQEGKPIDDVAGIDALLMNMEYSAHTDLGRQASDIGASFNVIKYFDELDSHPGVIPTLALDLFEQHNRDFINGMIAR